MPPTPSHYSVRQPARKFFKESEGLALALVRFLVRVDQM